MCSDPTGWEEGVGGQSDPLPASAPTAGRVLDPASSEQLLEALGEARSLGFLGPGPVERHLAHALGFASALSADDAGSVGQAGQAGQAGEPGPARPAPSDEGPATGEGGRLAGGGVPGRRPCPGRAVDLGSGGGVPGLVLALVWPTTALVLVEGGARRAGFLEQMARRLGVDDRVRVDGRRAEEVGRDPAMRGGADVVVARSFAPPAVTAECAAPLLSVGGRLVVSEPPEAEQAGSRRWPGSGLAELGMGSPRIVRVGFGYLVAEQVSPCPDRYPRRVGIPAKRPLF